MRHGTTSAESGTTRGHNRLAKKISVVAAGAALAAGLTVATPGTAWAERGPVSSGELTSKAGLRCGGQMRSTASASVSSFNIPIVQYAWIYYNCGEKTVRRKADIRNWWDGDCFGIGPGQARVLKAEWYGTGSANPFRGSKAC